MAFNPWNCEFSCVVHLLCFVNVVKSKGKSFAQTEIETEIFLLKKKSDKVLQIGWDPFILLKLKFFYWKYYK